jgi:hypothetical protein
MPSWGGEGRVLRHHFKEEDELNIWLWKPNGYSFITKLFVGY